MKIGDKVKYIGPDLVAYEKNKIYEIKSYDPELDMYGIESELEEIYLLPENVLEKV